MKKRSNWTKVLSLGLLVVAVGLPFVSASAAAAEKLAIATVYPGNMTDNEVYPALKYFETRLNAKTGGAYDV